MQITPMPSPVVSPEIAKTSEQVNKLTADAGWFERWKDRADVASVLLLLVAFVIGVVGNRLGAKLNKSNKELIAAKEQLNKLEIIAVPARANTES